MPRPRAATPRSRPPPPTLVLIKEDLDEFLVQARALADLLERLRASSSNPDSDPDDPDGDGDRDRDGGSPVVGVEIQAGDRGSLYLPRIRAIL